jgi:kinesin family protein C1
LKLYKIFHYLKYIFAFVQTENVTNGHNIDQLLRRAKKARAVATTNCNERSSRSHSVFILKIQGVNAKTGENCTGSLNLVDLAGSERLKDSGSTGQRLEETKNINTSLSSLSKVIMALANNKVISTTIPLIKRPVEI